MAFDFAALCDKIFDLQAKVDKVETKAKLDVKDWKLEIDTFEQQLILAMADGGLTMIKGKKAKAEIKESLRVSIKDFELLSTFLIRKKWLHLFERRISVKAYEEAKQSLGSKEIPGLSEFLQQRLNVTKA